MTAERFSPTQGVALANAANDREPIRWESGQPTLATWRSLQRRGYVRARLPGLSLSAGRCPYELTDAGRALWSGWRR